MHPRFPAPIPMVVSKVFYWKGGASFLQCHTHTHTHTHTQRPVWKTTFRSRAFSTVPCWSPKLVKRPFIGTRSFDSAALLWAKTKKKLNSLILRAGRLIQGVSCLASRRFSPRWYRQQGVSRWSNFTSVFTGVVPDKHNRASANHDTISMWSADNRHVTLFCCRATSAEEVAIRTVLCHKQQENSGCLGWLSALWAQKVVRW